MKYMENLLDALAECGEAAAFYKGQNIILANRLFADLFEKETSECKDLPIMEIIHEESIEMIRDFIKRRALGSIDIPTTYAAAFRTAHDPKLELQITILKTKKTAGAFLAIIQEIEND